MIEKLTKLMNLSNLTQYDIYSYLNFNERLTILYSRYEDYKNFNDLVKEKKLQLLTNEEAYKAVMEDTTVVIDGVNVSEPTALASYLTQEQLGDAIRKANYEPYLFIYALRDAKVIAGLIDDGFISAEYYQSVIYAMDDDKIKEEYMLKYLPKEDHSGVICTFKSDQNKLNALRLLPRSEKIEVIESFESDSLKEEFIHTMSFYRSTIIAHLKSNERKEYYLNKLLPILTSYEKAEIIYSFKDKELMHKYLHLLKSGKAVSDFISMSSGTDKYNDIVGELVSKLTKEKHILECLSYVRSRKIIKILLGKLKSEKSLMIALNSCRYNSSFIIDYLDKVSNKNKIELIKLIREPHILFDSLHKIDPKKIPAILEHADFFPEYKEEYRYIAEIYANIYKLNLDHLIELLKIVGFSLVNHLENTNIMKTINLPEEDFNNYLKIINVDNITVTESAQNDAINSIIQRMFRILRKDIYETGATIVHAIEDDDYETVRDQLTVMTLYKAIPREEVIPLYRSIKDPETKKEALTKLRAYTDKYVSLKRDEFYHEIIAEHKAELFTRKPTKKALVEFVLEECEDDEIIDTLDGIYQPLLTKEEKELINNRNLFYKLLDFKRNPQSFRLNGDEKKNITVLTNLLVKVFEDRVVYHFRGRDDVKYEVKKTNLNSIISIMQTLNPRKLKETIFNNEEEFKSLLELLNKTRMLGWVGKYDSITAQADVLVDADIIAELINNYIAIRERVKDSTDQLTITRMLDEASVYDTYSQKYSLLFGKDNFMLLKTDPSPNSSSYTKETRIKKAMELIPEMYKRKTIPVPGLDKDYTLENKKKINVVIGNTTDIINLTLGERTGACMRIGGAGDTLFDYALLGKNGFHIIFKDPSNGEFISRVSCFRNGNTVFMNQLRNSTSLNYADIDLVDAIKLVAKDIIALTDNSPKPVNNVVINGQYAMTSSNLPSIPLKVDDIKKGLPSFYSDIDSYGILLASTSKEGKLVPIITDKNTPEYLPQRSKVKYLLDEEAVREVAHFKLLDALITNHNIDSVDNSFDYNIVACASGEDWIISVDSNGQINEYILKTTKRRVEVNREMQEALQLLKANINVHENSRKIA